MKKTNHAIPGIPVHPALMPAQDAFADWKVYYTGKAGQMFGYGGRGSFPSKAQCESVRTSRPGFEEE